MKVQVLRDDKIYRVSKHYQFQHDLEGTLRDVYARYGDVRRALGTSRDELLVYMEERGE
jgi:hypothetical protein